MGQYLSNTICFMYKILIVEDEQRVASLIQTGLNELGFDASVAYDGDTGIRMFRSGGFSLVISDIVLPGKNGFELCREIRQDDTDIPIIMLTALGSTDDKLDGFDAGADDYMVKPFDLRELVARINILLKRKQTVAVHEQQPEIRYADLVIDRKTQKAYRNGTNIKLSPKEYKLLLYMAENADRVISRSEIAEKVWDTHFDTGTNFIDVYINYLRKKVDRDFETKLIHTRTGMGFIFTDKP